ncbi:hypothetical protein [Achromobacter insuavis]|uniref:hypothetical protein n=1 Tax=Achromobacter insuavis TaxID=1287735 RepID=UPI0015D3A93C|nr:hypothetical protein [Achromobacter insuavis]
MHSVQPTHVSETQQTMDDHMSEPASAPVSFRQKILSKEIKRAHAIRALPRKVVSPLISGVDAFIQRLDANQRATLLDIKEGRAADETITIPAAALVDLFLAHTAIQTARAKQAQKRGHATEVSVAPVRLNP